MAFSREDYAQFDHIPCFGETAGDILYFYGVRPTGQGLCEMLGELYTDRSGSIEYPGAVKVYRATSELQGAVEVRHDNFRDCWAELVATELYIRSK